MYQKQELEPWWVEKRLSALRDLGKPHLKTQPLFRLPLASKDFRRTKFYTTPATHHFLMKYTVSLLGSWEFYNNEDNSKAL